MSGPGEKAVAVVKAYDFVLWLVPKVEKFPRSHRFTIGDRLIEAALDWLLLLVEASYASRGKADLLRAADRRATSMRWLLRLSKDLQLMSVASYGFAAERVDEVGRMIGGWLKSTPESRP